MHIRAAYNAHSLRIRVHFIALITGYLMMSINCVNRHYVILCILLLSCPWDKSVFLKTLFSVSLGLTSFYVSRSAHLIR
jgi:hypothetical protein